MVFQFTVGFRNTTVLSWCFETPRTGDSKHHLTAPTAQSCEPPIVGFPITTSEDSNLLWRRFKSLEGASKHHFWWFETPFGVSKHHYCIVAWITIWCFETPLMVAWITIWCFEPPLLAVGLPIWHFYTSLMVFRNSNNDCYFNPIACLKCWEISTRWSMSWLELLNKQKME